MPLGRTYGHVMQNAFQNRIYYKPSIRRIIPRFPGVLRDSKKVIRINERFAEIKPAAQCKGKKFTDGSMQRCLREQLKGKLKKRE